MRLGTQSKQHKNWASCAYWDFSALHLNEREAREADLQRFLRESLPVQARGNLKIYSIYKMAVAALVFYRGHLEEHAHPRSDLRASYLWNATVPSAELVVVKYPWNATDDTPEITGLPPDIMLLAEIESLKHDMANLKADLASSFQETLIDQLDQRQVGGSGFARSNEILEKLETLIQKVSEVSLPAQTAPAAPLLPSLEDEPAPELEDACGFVSDDEEDVVLQLERPEGSADRTRFVRLRTQEQLSRRSVKEGFHQGHFSPLPSPLRFPKALTVMQLINLWLIGAENKHVPPLRKLSPCFFTT